MCVVISKSYQVKPFFVLLQRWWCGPGSGQCWLRDAHCTHHGTAQPEGLLPPPHYLRLLHSHLHHLHSPVA